jgi:hypothetical protein
VQSYICSVIICPTLRQVLCVPESLECFLWNKNRNNAVNTLKAVWSRSELGTTSQATSKRRENQIELQEVNFKRKIQARDGELEISLSSQIDF